MTLQAATGASKKHIYRPPISWDKIKKSMSSLLLLPALDTRWKCVSIFADVFGQSFSLARFGSGKTLLACMADAHTTSICVPAWAGTHTTFTYVLASANTHSLYMCLHVCLLLQTHKTFICVLASVNTHNLYVCSCLGTRKQTSICVRAWTGTHNLYMCACLGKPTQPLYVCVLW